MLLYIIIKVNPDLKSFQNLFRIIIIVNDDDDDDALGIELRCLHISGKYSTPELHCQL